ncbi:MAG: hypothetical protein E7655_02255 [Ruminococcaceae bacterium]|nr:hypothetical protein [Oscillospiraceae bacterium]
MKEKMKKLSDGLKVVFGYGIMLTLFVGGLTFFGYLAALIIGGETASLICECIYQKIVPVMIYVTTLMVLLGLLTMYLAGELALTAAKRNKKHKNAK